MIFEKNESPNKALTKFKLNKPTNPQLMAPTIIKNKQIRLQIFNFLRLLTFLLIVFLTYEKVYNAWIFRDVLFKIKEICDILIKRK